MNTFDRLPSYGFIHRPTFVKFSDDEGMPVTRRDERQKILETGWQQALLSLPEAERAKSPARIIAAFGDKTEQEILLDTVLMAYAAQGGPVFDSNKTDQFINTERFLGPARRMLLRLERLVKLMPQVGHAPKMLEAGEHTPGRVAIGHDGARITLEESFRMIVPAPGLVLEEHDRPFAALAAAIYPHVGLALGLAAVLLEHLDCRLVAMDKRLGHQYWPHRFVERFQ